MLRTILIVLIFIMMAGCVGSAPKAVVQKQAQIQRPANYEKVEVDFKDALNTYDSHSRWFERGEALELTLIGPVYKDPIEKESEAYKKLASLMKNIADDPKLLDKLSNKNLSSKYSKINYIPFKLGSKEDAAFTSVYEQRLDAKEKLTSVLRQLDSAGKDKTGETLAVWINPDDLKEKRYTLEGYKTVKTSDKERNSAYYYLSKENSNGSDNQEIINALLATLQLDIPEYTAIDRKEMLKDGENFRIIIDNPDGSANGKVYKFEIQTEVDKLNKQKEQTKDPRKLAELDRQIEAVKASKQWREYQTKQLLYEQPVSQNTIDILYRYGYIEKPYLFNQLTPTEGKQIAKALCMTLPDTFLLTQFDIYKKNLNALEINVGDIRRIGKAYYIRGLANTEAENSARNASGAKNAVADAGEVLASMAWAAFLPGNRSFNFNDTLEIPYVKEPEPKTSFYPTSGFGIESSGLTVVHEQHFKDLAKAKKTWKWSAPNDDRVIVPSPITFSDDKQWIYWYDGTRFVMKSVKTLEDVLEIKDIKDIVNSYVSVKYQNIIILTQENVLIYDFTGHLKKNIKYRNKNIFSSYLYPFSGYLSDDYCLVSTPSENYIIDVVKGNMITQENKSRVAWRQVPLTGGSRYLYAKDNKKVYIHDIQTDKDTLLLEDGDDRFLEITPEADNKIAIKSTLFAGPLKVLAKGVSDKERSTHLTIYSTKDLQKLTDKIIKVPGDVHCDLRKELCLVYGRGSTVLYDIKTDKVKATMDDVGGVNEAFVLDDGYVLINRRNDKDFYLLRENDLALVQRFNEHNGIIEKIITDGKKIFTQSMDGSIKAWDLDFLKTTEQAY